MDAQEEKTHQIRLSIDINSIRRCAFQGLVFAKYHPIKNFGMRAQFRTTPSIQIASKSEEKFHNSFKSFSFQVTQKELLRQFEARELVIETWHHDRIRQDHKVRNSTHA